MRLIIILALLLSLSAHSGPSYGRRHFRRQSRRFGGRGWSGGGVGGGNKIAVGTQCRLVKQTGGGGGGRCFQEQECGQVCSTVSQTQCSTVSSLQVSITVCFLRWSYLYSVLPYRPIQLSKLLLFPARCLRSSVSTSPASTAALSPRKPLSTVVIQLLQ